VRIESLTPRELEVLELMAEAKSSKEVADALGISMRTVEGHLLLIFRKLGVRNRTAAAKIWWKHQNGTGG
jgi:DNA-binding CsgD family transcriptional regulator